MKKTDLAVESAQLAAGMPGIRTVNRTIGGVKITDITIPEGISATRPAGRYITLEGDPAAPQLAALLSRAIGRLLPPEGLILAAGLGNPDITRDSLGAFTIRKLVPLTGNRYSLAAMETDVSARTGIETVRMLRAVAAEMNAACIFAVDSLCCRDPFRMCRTVQLSTGGITPGSGVEHSRRELSRKTAGVPVVACGVPTATLVSSITGEKAHSRFLAAPLDENIQVQLWAECISRAVGAVVR